MRSGLKLEAARLYGDYCRNLWFDSNEKYVFIEPGGKRRYVAVDDDGNCRCSYLDDGGTN